MIFRIQFRLCEGETLFIPFSLPVYVRKQFFFMPDAS